MVEWQTTFFSYILFGILLRCSKCIGRAYQHGQEQQVKASILVAGDSIETYIYKIQDQKRKKDLLLRMELRMKMKITTLTLTISTLLELITLKGGSVPVYLPICSH